MNPFVPMKTMILRKLGILDVQDSLQRISERQARLMDRVKQLEDTSKTHHRALERTRESVLDCTAAIEALTEGLTPVAPLLDDARSGRNTIVIGRLSETVATQPQSNTAPPSRNDPKG